MKSQSLRSVTAADLSLTHRVVNIKVFSIWLAILVTVVCSAPFLLIGKPNPSPQELQSTKETAAAQDEPAASDVEWNGPWVSLERAYPNLRFDRPVYLTNAGDGSGRMFVVEQSGVIRVIPKAALAEQSDVANAPVFLDIREQVSRRGNEQGLLGLAFHPDFKKNGKLYVHYSSKKHVRNRRTSAPNIISQFTVSESDANVADRESEKIILKQEQPYSNHNGGMIEFGPDGFLYASFGDGGSADDPRGNGQNLKTLLGAIIRINVDEASDDLAYSIPEDNPFVGNEEARDELWAVGLRNVWRFAFDRRDGRLFAADVGQNKLEEVCLVERGGNYGWNRFEADNVFRKNVKLSVGEHIPPIASYDHSWGISITGGYVYRGKAYPKLDGVYFYGDYVSGNLWGLRKNKDGKFQSKLLLRTGRSIASFGEDEDGEVYLLSFDGGIYKIVSSDKPQELLADWPKKLSETGLYTSIRKKKLADDLTPYQVNAPFWSDNAGKTRFIKLPVGQKMEYKAKGTWKLPVGTVVVKNFDKAGYRGKQMLETRLIKRTKEGWEAATYVWNSRQNDADLKPEGSQFEFYTRQGITSWHAPSSSECASCHVESSGFVLGLTTAQLNREDEGVNQISAWAEKGLLELPEGVDLATADKFCSPFGDDGSLEERARVYLDVNCAMCHQPNGPGNATIDLRFDTELAGTGMVGEAPAQNNMGIEDAEIVAAGSPDRSTLLSRLETPGTGRMPSIGSNIVDKKAVKLISEWIESLK